MCNILNVICAVSTTSEILLCALIVLSAVIIVVFSALVFLNFYGKNKINGKLPNDCADSSKKLETLKTSFEDAVIDEKSEKSLKPCYPDSIEKEPFSYRILTAEEVQAIFEEVFTPSVPPICDERLKVAGAFDLDKVLPLTSFEKEPCDAPLNLDSDDNAVDVNVDVNNERVNDFFGLQSRVRYIRSFTAKLCQANDLVKERYNLLKNELMSYKKVKSRKSWNYETFRLGAPVIAKIAIIGKTLSLYLALSPQDFVDSKYTFKDVSAVKKYSAVPMRLKIKSNRSVRCAKELISVMAEQNGWTRLNLQEVDYYPEYRTTEDLIMDKEIKLMGTENTEIIGENLNNDLPETEAQDKFTAYTDPLAVIMEIDLDESDSQSADEVCDAEEVMQEEVACTESATESNEEVSEEPAEAVEEPIEIIEPETVETEEVAADSEETLEETEDTEEAEDTEAEYVVPERDFELVPEVSVLSADKKMTDEKAESLIEAMSVSSAKHGGSGKSIVNIDTLSDNYNAGEVVTLENLKAKKLVPKKADSVKVLGRGVIDKPLTVEADGFTINAAKMILLTGGRVIRIVK